MFERQLAHFDGHGPREIRRTVGVHMGFHDFKIKAERQIRTGRYKFDF
jgi:hypothetical protein